MSDMFENLMKRSWILQLYITAATTFRNLISHSPVSRKWCVALLVLMFMYCSGVVFFYHFFPDHSFFYFPLLVLLAFAVIGLLFFVLLKANLYRNGDRNTMPSAWIIFTIIVILHFLCYLLTQRYDFSIRTDVRNQWGCIVTQQFNDWHPLLHTCMLWFVYWLTGSVIWTIFLFQTAFAMCCAWLYHTLNIYHYRSGIIWGTVILIGASPLMFCMLGFLDKDVPFAIAAFGCMISLIHIWHTKGSWLCRIRNFLGFILLLLITALLRHNGIFFIIPLLVLLPLIIASQYRKRCFVLIGIAAICLLGHVWIRDILLQKHVIEHRWGESVSQTYLETIGVPMAVMIEVYLNAPDKMEPETIAFFDSIASREYYGKYFDGTYNSIKFKKSSEIRNVLQHLLPSKFIKMFVHTLCKAPGFSLRAIQYETYLGFAPLQHNDAHFLYGDISSLKINSLCVTFMIRHIVAQPGMMMLLLVIFGSFGFLRHGWKILPVVIPLFAYGFGTSLLLCGWDFRFFYILFLCTPIALLLCCDNLQCKEEELTSER